MELKRTSSTQEDESHGCSKAWNGRMSCKNIQYTEHYVMMPQGFQKHELRWDEIFMQQSLSVASPSSGKQSREWGKMEEQRQSWWVCTGPGWQHLQVLRTIWWEEKGWPVETWMSN